MFGRRPNSTPAAGMDPALVITVALNVRVHGNLIVSHDRDGSRSRLILPVADSSGDPITFTCATLAITPTARLKDRGPRPRPCHQGLRARAAIRCAVIATVSSPLVVARGGEHIENMRPTRAKRRCRQG